MAIAWELVQSGCVLTTDVRCAEAPPGTANQHEVLQFVGQAADGTDVQVKIARDYEQQGVGYSTIWRGSMMQVSLSADIFCMVDDDVVYENTHHNWADDVEGEDDLQRYVLEMRYTLAGDDFVWEDALSIFPPQSDVSSFGPLVLTYEAGPTRD